MSDLFQRIEKLLNTGPMHGWTSVTKAQTFAAAVIALKPEVSCEIGCWAGRATFAVGLAHKEIGRGVIHTIDPWSPAASAEGQGEADRKHWESADHESVYAGFMHNRHALGLDRIIEVHRMKSCDFLPPDGIGLLLIDGNHGPAAIDDVARYAPNVIGGGLVYLDDLQWSGGFVAKAEEKLLSMGFRRMYAIETGAMYMRI